MTTLTAETWTVVFDPNMLNEDHVAPVPIDALAGAVVGDTVTVVEPESGLSRQARFIRVGRTGKLGYLLVDLTSIVELET